MKFVTSSSKPTASKNKLLVHPEIKNTIELMPMALVFSSAFRGLIDHVDLIRSMTDSALVHGLAQLPQRVFGVF